jgi:thiol:disulfide interchange protein DsbD
MRPSVITRSFLLYLTLAATVAGGADLPTTSTLNTTATLNNSSEVVPADIAFTLNAFVEADGNIALVWEFPQRYYLYRKSLTAQKADGTSLNLELPDGALVSDEFFGESEVYFERLLARIPAATLNAADGSTLELQLGYQGCVQDTLCYPPQVKVVILQLPE